MTCWKRPNRWRFSRTPSDARTGDICRTSKRHAVRALLACLLALGVTVPLVGCARSGQHDREASRHAIEAALSELDAPVIGPETAELDSGTRIYLNVSVQVAQGIESISPDALHKLLEIIAHGAHPRYPSVDIDVSTPDFKPVAISDLAAELVVPDYVHTGAGTLAINRIDLVEWVETFP